MTDLRQPSAPSTSPARPGRRAFLTGGLAALLAAGGASGWALDRFVVDHVEISDVASYEEGRAGATSGAAASSAGATTGVVSGTSYTGDRATIAVSTKVTGSGQQTVTSYLADIRLTDATALRSAFAQNAFGTNIIENPSTTARRVGAVFAVNGDYYGFRDTGIVVRNGVAYRDEGARQGLALYRDGTVKLYDETTTSAAKLIAAGVWNTLSFGPGLVDGGRIVDGIDDIEIDTNVGNHSIQGAQPRTGIGVVDANRIVIIVVDGRSPGYSRGVTMSEFAQMFVDAGASVAYNLDGGGSSALYFNGSLVNNPLGKGQERGTSDILYVAG